MQGGKKQTPKCHYIKDEERETEKERNQGKRREGGQKLRYILEGKQ